MSYDLQIWSIKRSDLTELLAKHDFKRSGDDFCYEAKEWQIVINAQSEVLDEDIPEQIMNILPGTKFLMEINLEPSGAPKKAVTLTKKIAQQIAKLISGVIINPQEDTITTPKGIKRFFQTEKLAKLDIVEMSWWMNHDEFTSSDNLQKFVEKIEVYLPEALPGRYGLTEPPQHKYKSKEELVNFLVQNERSIVWYPHYPVMGFHLAIPSKVGPITWGGKPSYRASHIGVSLDAAVLESDGWPLALKRFFREMSIFLKPFYGDIRVLHNYLRGKGTFFTNSQTEDHPIKSWWWRGIPKKVGISLVLGDPLTELWPDFLKKSENISNLYIADSYQDNKLYELDPRLFNIPKGLIQPEDETFPELWPFEWPEVPK